MELSNLKVAVDLDRAKGFVLGQATSIGDVVKEFIHNSIDAIPDPKDGRITITVGKDTLTILDNGKGCTDPSRFVKFFGEPEEGTNIALHGIGIKTAFGMFKKVAIISKEAKDEHILVVDGFQLEKDTCQVALVAASEKEYKELRPLLDGNSGTRITLSEPIDKAFGEELVEKAELTSFANSCKRYMWKGGKISLKDNREEKNADIPFTVSQAITYQHRIDSATGGKIGETQIQKLETHVPGDCVEVRYTVSAEVADDPHADIYFADAWIGNTSQLLPNLRFGSKSRIQSLTVLPFSMGKRGQIGHNKHSIINCRDILDWLKLVHKAIAGEATKLERAAKQSQHVNLPQLRKQVKGFEKKLVEALEGNQLTEPIAKSIKVTVDALRHTHQELETQPATQEEKVAA